MTKLIKNLCYEKNTIFGYDLIKRYFRVEFYFISYRPQFDEFFAFVLLIWQKYIITEMIKIMLWEEFH